MYFKIDESCKPGILLHSLIAELTFYHSTLACGDTKFFDMIFGPTERYLDTLADRIAPNVKLHVDRVLLLESSCNFAWFYAWASKEGFESEEPIRWFATTSDTPIQDGFFECLRAVCSASPEEDNLGALKWRELDTAASQCSINEIISRFVEQEGTRTGAGHEVLGSCGSFLRRLHHEKGRIHKSDQGYFFDTEQACLEFAAAVVSSQELRFWSRPVLIPK